MDVQNLLASEDAAQEEKPADEAPPEADAPASVLRPNEGSKPDSIVIYSLFLDQAPDCIEILPSWQASSLLELLESQIQAIPNPEFGFGILG